MSQLLCTVLGHQLSRRQMHSFTFKPVGVCKRCGSGIALEERKWKTAA